MEEFVISMISRDNEVGGLEKVMFLIGEEICEYDELEEKEVMFLIGETVCECNNLDDLGIGHLVSGNGLVVKVNLLSFYKEKKIVIFFIFCNYKSLTTAFDHLAKYIFRRYRSRDFSINCWFWIGEFRSFGYFF